VYNEIIIIPNFVASCKSILTVLSDYDYRIADTIAHGLACACVGAASQRAVYRWWGAHASCLLDSYRVIYKQFLPNNY